MLRISSAGIWKAKLSNFFVIRGRPPTLLVASFVGKNYLLPFSYSFDTLLFLNTATFDCTLAGVQATYNALQGLSQSNPVS